MAKHNIMAISLNHRSNKAGEVQQTLTEYGCLIKMRLGLHEAGDVCSENGLLLLQLVDSEEKISELENRLKEIEGVDAKTISI
jgi:hypothetical protein